MPTTGSGDDLSWVLASDGMYHGNNAAAFAVRCDDALVIAFRGTNDNDNTNTSPDQADWFNMSGHYDELRPFIDKVDAYAAAHNIAKVYVTGHSLGGGMALGYMDKHPDNSKTTANGSTISYRSVTFAAPGYLLAGTLDPRVICMEVDGDPVPDLKYHQGYILAVNTEELQHLDDDNNSYSGADFHTMDLYREVSRALDMELPDTGDSSPFFHGLDETLFSSLTGLEVNLAVRESSIRKSRFSILFKTSVPSFPLAASVSIKTKL